jgi:hypothetical protein
VLGETAQRQVAANAFHLVRPQFPHGDHRV